MSRSVVAAVIVLLFAGTIAAADPTLRRAVKSPSDKTSFVHSPLAQALANIDARERQIVRDVVGSFGTPIEHFFTLVQLQIDGSLANYRMNGLLNESEELRLARKQCHQFWMNNQAAVLTYERLNGAVDK